MKKLNMGRICLLAAAVVAVTGSVLYYLLDGGDKTFTWLGVVFAVAGAASTVACFTRFDPAGFVTAVLYSASFGFVLRVAIPSLSDVWNKVNFIGGNAAMGAIFSVTYLVCAVLAVISCFSGTTES